MKNKLITGYALALLATALWSGNFIVARDLSESVHPFSLSFYRWLVATIIFTPFAIKRVIHDWGIIRKHFLYLIVTALLGVSIFNTLIYFAGRSTAAVNMSLIMLTFPIYILIISAILFKEKIGFKKVAGIVVVLIGVIGIVTKGQWLDIFNIKLNSGDPLMLLAALIFATHSILVKTKPKKLSIFSLQYMTFLLGVLILFPFHLWSFKQNGNVEFTGSMVGSILYIGIFSSLISFVSWNKAIDRIGASTAGMIYYLLPLFSGLAAWIILSEKLKYYHLFSGVLIVTGILISNHKSTQNKKTAREIL
ncbi:MAG: DMT family transporter [Bacteroidales bacterium]|nr:DMT family transporter [Bacteroidales bacterium]